MAEPLEYRNPFLPKVSEPSAARADAVIKAIPIEFDACIADTDDHAAVRAIETALERAKIEYFRGDNGERVVRQVTLHVRSADRDRAMDLAGPIFVRRAKFRAHPKTPSVGLRESAPGLGGIF